jgi:hypothetical protein
VVLPLIGFSTKRKYTLRGGNFIALDVHTEKDDLYFACEANALNLRRRLTHSSLLFVSFCRDSSFSFSTVNPIIND